jgi:DNA-binding NtrC family response regulator
MSNVAGSTPAPAQSSSPSIPPCGGLDLQSLPVLLVDDEPDNLDAFRFNFRKSFRILTAQSGTEGLAILQQERVAVLVTDQRMPRMTGLEFLARARAIAPDAVPIILTAYTDVDVLIEAINLGHVYRYITKPWDAKEVRGILLQALERYHLRAENSRLSEQLQQYAGYLNQEWHGAFNFGQLVGNSQVLKASLHRAEQVARTHATVLLRGESGTGKELVAHAIHINSPREGKPFVRVNCAALAGGVLESELFGHERGSFTGAMSRHPGRFELADGGTLFLDEIGDLPMDVQVKLLRVLQERTFERVGGTETLRVDVRIISATHRNLEALVAEGKFREDLYYRLNVFPIVLPPLRERIDDIPLLCQHFLEKWRHHSSGRVTGIDSAALEMLLQYSFPGNVRELENLIERALILASGPEIGVSELEFSRPGGRRPQNPLPAPAAPAPVPAAAPAVAPSPPPPPAAPAAPATPVVAEPSPSGPSLASRSLADRLSEQERAEILLAIERSDGNIAAAARLLGINRSTLYYRLRKHDLLHLLPSRPDSES